MPKLIILFLAYDGVCIDVEKMLMRVIFPLPKLLHSVGERQLCMLDLHDGKACPRGNTRGSCFKDR
jgi:hypothetical protein